MRSSTAAGLEQLWSLEISGCSMIEEIVAADDSQQDHHHITIIFTNLKFLLLKKLPRLTNFCTANNYTFNFPQLKRVTVYKCPNMSTFSPGITITPTLEEVSFEGDLNTTIQHFFSQMEPQRLTTTDPSTSSNNHVEPEGCIHEKPTESLGKEAEKIFEEVTEPRKDGQICEHGVGELGKKAEIFENVIMPENETEDSEHDVEPREFVGFFEQCNEQRNGTDICEEVVEEGKVADSCEKGKGKEVETESRNSEDHLNGDLNTIVQDLYSEMETPRLIAADPTTCEPEAQIHDNPTESAANEIQEISKESTSKPREEIRTRVDATEPSAKVKEKMQISREDPNYYQDQASSSNTSAIHFYEESSVPTDQQSEKSEETVPYSANEPEEQTNAGSNSLLNEEQGTKRLGTTDPSTSRKQTEICEGETCNHPRLECNIEATNSQPINKDFIPLLNKVTQILQTQPLNSMSAQQVQFMEDAFRDLSTMKFSIERFSPFIGKARDCVSVAGREREISEFELKIAETKALLQALEENKKALEDKNSASASGMDLGKSVYDN